MSRQAFVLGVEDRFALLNTKDIVVVGVCEGNCESGGSSLRNQLLG